MKLYRKIILFFIIFAALMTAIIYFVFYNKINSLQGLYTWYTSKYIMPLDYLTFYTSLYAIFLLLSFALLNAVLHPLKALSKNSKNTAAIPEKIQNEDIVFAEQIHKQIYQEPITGLGNRHYFDNVLKQVLSGSAAMGALLLLEIEGLKEFNEKEGYLAGNEFIRKIATVIQENSYDIKLNFLAKIGGSTFVIIAPHYNQEEINNRAVSLIHAMEEAITVYKNKVHSVKEIHVHIGVASFSGIKNSSELLSQADMALKKAIELGPFSYAYCKDIRASVGEMAIRNIQGWGEYIQQLIKDEKITVVYQPVISIPDKTILSYEALLRIKKDNQNLTEAKLIVPTAERYGLMHVLDQSIIKQVLTLVKSTKTDTPYSINLSANTLNNKESLNWLIKTLSTGEYSNKIILELDDHTVLNNLPLVSSLIQSLEKYKIGFGLDYYGYDFSGFEYLKTLPFSYIKLDGSYIRSLDKQYSQFFIRFLARMTHNMNKKVIAKCVETQEQWDLLASCHIDAAQGNFCEDHNAPAS